MIFKRLVYLAYFYLLTILIFMAGKVVFMLSHGSEHPFGFSDLLDVIGHGASLDFSMGLYLLAFPFLFVWVTTWVQLPRWIMKSYLWIVATLMSLAFVADTSLYSFWQFKLDASCLQYLDSPTGITSSVSTGYLLMRFLYFVLFTLLIRYTYHYALSRLELPCRSSSRQGLIFSLMMLLITPLIIIGIRGGLGESTTNVGQVYYSPNQFFNHSAINPMFSFLSSVGKSGDYIVKYAYFDEKDCDALVEGIFDTRSPAPDTLLNTSRPNILIVILESCGGQFTSLGDHPEITPQFNQLCHEGVYFTQCYANSWRTDKGCVSILSGYPAFPITSVMKVPEKSRKLPSIAKTLKTEGYDNEFLYGGDINFANMRSYVMGTGYDRLRCKDDYSSEEQTSAKWGVRDDVMFCHLFNGIQKQTSGPWMKTFLTLSSHEPWDVPTKVLDDEVYNAFHYLDTSLGQFVAQLKQSPVWNELLLIILPDHGYRCKSINETTRLFNHIPMLWLGGAVKVPRRIDRICNQSDLAAILFGQMGIDHSHFTFSRDVVGNAKLRPVAFHTFVNGYTVIDSCGFTAFDLDADKVIAGEGDNETSRLKLGKALLQHTSSDL